LRLCSTKNFIDFTDLTMKRFLSGLLLLSLLVACSGVPLRSLPQLMQLSGDILETSPAEVMVALQVDARLSPPAGAVPMLVIKMTPSEPGAFEAIDRKLPLQVTTVSAATAGLKAPPQGRNWLLYSMPAATQTELLRIQALVRTLKASGQKGSLGLGVEQDSLAVTSPALAETRWETWLQVKKANGFFEVWSGTLTQLRKAAEKAK
jgi:hypothetical protein